MRRRSCWISHVLRRGIASRHILKQEREVTIEKTGALGALMDFKDTSKGTLGSTENEFIKETA